MTRESWRIAASTLLLPFLLFGSAIARTQQEDSLPSRLQAAFDRRDYDAVVELGEQLLALEPTSSLALHHTGYAWHAKGEYDKALVYHRRGAELKNDPYAATAAYNAGCAYALKGDADAAFEWLEKSVAAGFRDSKQLQSDSDLASLREDPRFTALAAKLGAAKPRAQGPFVASQKMERAGTRVAMFRENGGVGQVAIEYGPVAWKDEFDAALASGKLDGKRWRLGNDFWTNLSADVPFRLGKVDFEPGEYYLLLEKAGDEYTLVVRAAAEIRSTKQDAFWAHDVSGGAAVPLKHAAGEKAEKLDLTLATTSNESKSGSLTIRFGKHALSTSFEVRE